MRTRALPLALALLLAGSACSKKEQKPLRTEPWLAHPPASASPSAAASSDAGPDSGKTEKNCNISSDSFVEVTLTAERSRRYFGKGQVNGFVAFEPTDLTRSRGLARVDVRRLTFGERADAPDPALTELARQVLDASSDAAGARFELTRLDDPSVTAFEPIPESTPLPVKRKLRATAVGTLLVHGFRVERRVPVLAEYGFVENRQAPDEATIWTAKPVVISLDTHAITAKDLGGKPAKVGNVSVTIQIHCRYLDPSKAVLKPSGRVPVPVVP